MLNYTEFKGINLITDPTRKINSKFLLKAFVALVLYFVIFSKGALACDSGYLLVNRIHYNSDLDKKFFGGLCYRGEFVDEVKREVYDGLPPIKQTALLNLKLWYNNAKRPMLYRNNGVIIYCNLDDAVKDVGVSFNLNNRGKNYAFGDFYPCPGYKDGGGSFVNEEIVKNVVLLDEKYYKDSRPVKIMSYHKVSDKIFAFVKLINQ